MIPWGDNIISILVNMQEVKFLVPSKKLSQMEKPNVWQKYLHRVYWSHRNSIVPKVDFPPWKNMRSLSTGVHLIHFILLGSQSWPQRLLCYLVGGTRWAVEGGFFFVFSFLYNNIVWRLGKIKKYLYLKWIFAEQKSYGF